MALLALFALAVLARAQEISLEGIDPLSGSLAGGTLLTVFGSGFPVSEVERPSTIYIGNSACHVVYYYSTSTQIVCETAAAPPGMPPVPQAVTLAVGAGAGLEPESATACCFTYHEDSTPVVNGISPPAGEPGGAVVVKGPRYQFASSIDDIVSVRFGRDICAVETEEPESLSLIDSNKNYGLECDLSDAGGVEGQSGSFNVTVSLVGQGHALPARDSYLVDAAGVPYMYQVHPRVDAVAPPTGSSAGGTLLTITGVGFPDYNEEVGGSASAPPVEVEAGGAPCRVVSSSYSEVVCATAELSASAPAQGAVMAYPDLPPPPRVYPGGRGMEVSWWSIDPSWKTASRWREEGFSQGEVPNATFVETSLFEVSTVEEENIGLRAAGRLLPAVPCTRNCPLGAPISRMNGLWLRAGRGRGSKRAALPSRGRISANHGEAY